MAIDLSFAEDNQEEVVDISVTRVGVEEQDISAQQPKAEDNREEDVALPGTKVVVEEQDISAQEPEAVDNREEDVVLPGTKVIVEEPDISAEDSKAVYIDLSSPEDNQEYEVPPVAKAVEESFDDPAPEGEPEAPEGEPDIDVFLRDLYDAITDQTPGEVKWIQFIGGGQGGFYFNNTQRRRFQQELARPDRDVPESFPNSWEGFLRLMKSYEGFVYNRHTCRFTHDQFLQEGAKLHLIRKKPTAEERARLRREARRAQRAEDNLRHRVAEHVETVLKPLFTMQRQITGFAENLCEEVHELDPGVNTALDEFTKTIEGWASVCEMELYSMMSSWQDGYGRRSVQQLLWKHYHLADLCYSLLGHDIQEIDPRHAVVGWVTDNYTTLLLESLGQLENLEAALNYLQALNVGAIGLAGPGFGRGIPPAQPQHHMLRGPPPPMPGQTSTTLGSHFSGQLGVADPIGFHAGGRGIPPAQPQHHMLRGPPPHMPGQTSATRSHFSGQLGVADPIGFHAGGRGIPPAQPQHHMLRGPPPHMPGQTSATLGSRFSGQLGVADPIGFHADGRGIPPAQPQHHMLRGPPPPMPGRTSTTLGSHFSGQLGVADPIGFHAGGRGIPPAQPQHHMLRGPPPHMPGQTSATLGSRFSGQLGSRGIPIVPLAEAAAQPPPQQMQRGPPPPMHDQISVRRGSPFPGELGVAGPGLGHAASRGIPIVPLAEAASHPAGFHGQPSQPLPPMPGQISGQPPRSGMKGSPRPGAFHVFDHPCPGMPPPPRSQKHHNQEQ